jgi:hypothetical protein
MLISKPRRLAISIVAAALLLATGGWFAQREISCRQLARQASAYPDAQVRRGAGGACRMCRDKGWLYDIAFDPCVKADRAYAGVRIP